MSATDNSLEDFARAIELGNSSQVVAEFKRLYGSGSAEVRIEYVDSLHGLLPIVVSAGSTFVHSTTPNQRITFSLPTLPCRFE
jgi:hypothetical protein